MDVYFLNPPFLADFSRSERSPQVAKSGTIYFPVWLTQAAAYIESHGHRIDLKDAIAGKMNLPDICNWINNGKPDCLVMETSTASIAHDLKTARVIKSISPEIILVLVGPHVSATPQTTMHQAPFVDFLVCGEYELPLAELFFTLENHGDLGTVKGIAWRKGDHILVNAATPVIENLDVIPFASELYKRFLNYRDYYFAAANYPGIMLMTGRGCPHRCVWCLFNQTLHGRKYRYRSPENIIAEFEYISANFPDIKEIWIDDDTFTADKKHLQQVCQCIIDRGLKFQKAPFHWYCNARPPLDLATMRLMKKAGCRLLVTGFESGSPDILKSMHKGFTVEQGHRFMGNARKARLLVHGCFVIGNVGETRETMKKTLQYAKKLLPDSAQFYFVHPYPGTEYYQWAKDNNYLATEDYGQWLDENGYHRCIIDLPGLTGQQMQDFCDYAYQAYHFSFPYLAIKIRQLLMQPREGVRSLRAGVKFIFGRK